MTTPERTDANLLTVPVDDPADDRISAFTDLTDVRLRMSREPKEGLFMAESIAVIERAIAAGFDAISVLTEPKWLEHLAPLLPRDVPVYVGSEAVITATTGFRMHRGPMAAMRRRTLAEVDEVTDNADWIVVLDGLVDHTNVGAAFRSAAGFGAGAVLVSSTCADPLYRRSIRVSMGTVFQVPWTRMSDSQDLSGFATLALTPDPAAPVLSETLAAFADERVALVVGTEGAGLAGSTLAKANARVRIPMSGGVDSLNVAAAVAVACYAVAQSRAN